MHKCVFILDLLGGLVVHWSLCVVRSYLRDFFFVVFDVAFTSGICLFVGKFGLRGSFIVLSSIGFL